MQKQGLFITLEGIEGVGKSTAVAHVASIMRQLGYEVVLTREPGGTAIGEQIRALLLAPESQAMAPMTELLLMFAARAQHLAEVIEPGIAAGRCVICDRFTDATFAYQGGGRGLEQTTIALAQSLVHPQRRPHLTLLLDAPVALALARARTRSAADRFETEELDFFERVRTSYLLLAQQEPQRFRIIDASPPLNDVRSALRRTLERRFA